MTVGGHLEELRRRLLWASAAVGAGLVASFFFCDRLLHFLLRPVLPQIGQTYFFSPTEAFVVKIKVAFFSGVVLASPVVAWQIWLFVKPALRPSETRWVGPAAILTTALFLVGVFFSFWVVVPAALRFLVGMQNEFLKPMISVNEYLGFLMGISLAFGISFNLPLFLALLAALGVVSSQMLWKYQRHAVLLIFIAAAILTPGPDVASQLLLAGPLMLLYELGLVLAKCIEGFKKTSHV